MTEIEKLEFQRDIESIKHHIRNSMNSACIFSWLNHSGYEIFECSSCGAQSKDPYGEDLEYDIETLHKEGCEYVSKIESKRILWNWAKL